MVGWPRMLLELQAPGYFCLSGQAGLPDLQAGLPECRVG
jgi:hypothetical protein